MSKKPTITEVDAMLAEMQAEIQALTAGVQGLTAYRKSLTGSNNGGAEIINEPQHTAAPIDTGTDVVFTLPSAMRAFIKQQNGYEFTVTDAYRGLLNLGYTTKSNNPKVRISGEIKKLFDDDKLVRSFTGHGCVPHKYKEAGQVTVHLKEVSND